MAKQRRVEIRLDEIDYKCLKRLADNDGLSVSEYIRRLIIKNCK
jgi:predicted DNA binding CopG/RHH family protein